MRVHAVATILALLTLQACPQEPLTLARKVAPPGVEGRIDHLAVDLRAERLFVAALGNNTVEVLDLKTGLHLKSLAGFHEPQGIAVLTDAGVVAVANGQGDGVQLLDAGSLTSKATVTLGGRRRQRPSGCLSASCVRRVRQRRACGVRHDRRQGSRSGEARRAS